MARWAVRGLQCSHVGAGSHVGAAASSSHVQGQQGRGRPGLGAGEEAPARSRHAISCRRHRRLPLLARVTRAAPRVTATDSAPRGVIPAVVPVAGSLAVGWECVCKESASTSDHQSVHRRHQRSPICTLTRGLPRLCAQVVRRAAASPPSIAHPVVCFLRWCRWRLHRRGCAAVRVTSRHLVPPPPTAPVACARHACRAACHRHR